MKKNMKTTVGLVFLVLCGIIVQMLMSELASGRMDEVKKSKVHYVDYRGSSIVTVLHASKEGVAEGVYLSEEEYMEKAECIVKGKIKKIQYCEYQGTPWRRLNFQVTDTMAGENRKGEDIVVYVIGGYLSSKEYYSYYFDKKVPKDKEEELFQLEMRPMQSIVEERDTEILLIKKASQESPFESTAYECVGGYETEFIYDEKQNQYKQYKNDGGIKLWKEEKLYQKLAD